MSTDGGGRTNEGINDADCKDGSAGGGGDELCSVAVLSGGAGRGRLKFPARAVVAAWLVATLGSLLIGPAPSTILRQEKLFKSVFLCWHPHQGLYG